MNVRRRSFIKGIAAAVAIPLIPKIGQPQIARATSRAWAARFGGNTYLQNNGPIANMPATSFIWTLCYNYRTVNNAPGGVFSIAASGSPISRAADVSHNSNGTLSIRLWGPAKQTGQNSIEATVSGLPSDGGYHNVIVSCNGQTPLIKVMIDGANKTPTVNVFNGTDVASQFSGICNVGGFFTGDLADLGMFAGAPFIDPANIVDFVYDVENFFAIRNASSGANIVLNRRPQVWLSGPALMFPRNFAAGKWNILSNNPSYVDTNPTSAFTVVGDPLMDADTDPFEA